MTAMSVAGVTYYLVDMGISHWIAFSFSILLASGIGLVMSRMVYKPVQNMNKSIEIVRSGNLDYRIESDSKDEIGELCKSLNNLVADLQKATNEIYDLNQISSDYQETEKALKKKEDYFRRLFEYSNDAVFIYDFDGTVLDVNKKACDMLGHSKEKLLKIPFQDLQTEEELIRSKAAFRTNPKTGSIRFESKFQKNDQSVIDVEISSSIVDLKKGIMQSIVSNITERKRMEKSLRDSEEKFRTFMETASDLMYITNADGLLTYVNNAMATTLGYAKEEMIGMPFSEVLDKDNLEKSKIKRQELIEVGENIHLLSWETKTRKKIFGEMKAVAFFNNEGQFQGIRGVFRDITERKKIEESQRLTQLGKLAADMAHEVKNQIAVISTRSSISLMRKLGNKDLEKDLTIIKKQCDQINDIVKRLLMFSKPSKRDYKKLNINDSIDFVINLVEPQFQQKNVKIIKEFTSPLPEVEIDEKQMQEVFMNLMRNGFEAMTDGGTITVTTQQKNNQIQIDFADTGIGISESDMKQIFDPFFTTKEHGTGLGLSVCYGIIKIHNGDLKYTSQMGKGTTASIELPLPGA